MAKVKVSPFFYLMLGRDSDGKLTFDVFDIACEGEIPFKKISNDNGLLKYEDRKENIKEYIEDLINDIAVVYSRMGRIVISYKGDIAHSELVKKTVNMYNATHEEDEKKPIFLFHELNDNFSLDEYVKRINLNLENAMECVRSISFDEPCLENEPEIEFDSGDFVNILLDRDCDMNQLKKIVDEYKELSENKRQSFAEQKITMFPLSNSEIPMYYSYLKSQVNDDVKVAVSEHRFYVSELNFIINDNIEQSEFLNYIDMQKNHLDKYIHNLNDQIKRYDKQINKTEEENQSVRNRITDDIKIRIEKNIEKAINGLLAEQIKNAYDQFMKDISLVGIEVSDGKELDESQLKTVTDIVIDRYKAMAENKFKPEAVNVINRFENYVYGIVNSAIAKSFPDSNIMDYEEYRLKFSFVNSETEKMLTEKLNPLFKRNDILEGVVVKNVIFHKNVYGVDYEQKNGKKYYIVKSVDAWLNNIRSKVYGLYSESMVVRRITKIMTERMNGYIEKTVPYIIRSLPKFEENITVRDLNDKMSVLEKQHRDLRILYMNLIDTQKQLNNIRDMYTGKVSLGKEV